MMQKVGVIHSLVLCKGNICRSPILEGLLQAAAEADGKGPKFRIDSAGTSSLHRGEPPDIRSIEVAMRHGLSISDQRSRPLTKEDLLQFDFIIAMDRSNRAFVEALGSFPPERLLLARHFDPEALEHDVPDPWYGGPDSFLDVFQMLERATAPLLRHLESLGPRTDR